MTEFVGYMKLLSQVIASLCNMLAMIVIVIGIAKAFRIYLYDFFNKLKSKMAFRESRVELGHSFSLALGILIGASILNTAIAPSWNDIGQLAAIIAIRIVLNHFLLRDVRIDEQSCLVTTTATSREKGE